MPRKDGTGPLGKGPGTGRGQGRCGHGSKKQADSSKGLGLRKKAD
jgi:hypothetical protein